jgi:lipopolysaccharide transport system permease protein
MVSLIKPLWNYRGFIIGTVKREFQSKYSNSLLGAAWTVLNPLAMILIYTLVFSRLMKARLPGVESVFAYSIYLCAGVFTWGLFTEITGRGQTIFLENANLLKKLSFPRLCLPAIVILTASLNFAISFGLFLLFLVITGNLPGWPLLAVIPVLLLQLVFAIALGISLGVLNVFFRDVGQFFGIILQFWFWLTPIVYSPTVLPSWAIRWMQLNPMSGLIGAYQTIFVSRQWPQWNALLPAAILSILLWWIAMRLYLRHAGEMMDEL